MRAPFVVALSCACIILWAVFGAAQSAPSSHGILADPTLFADKHIAALDAQLNLSSEQKTKLRPIFVEELKKVQVVLASSLGVEERQEEIGKIRAETHDHVADVLTPEQKKRFEDIQPQAPPEPRPGTSRI